MPRKQKPQGLLEPKHFSHSARETLERCAKSYFLKYLTPAPRTPALWLAGGSAVHEATEAYDRWDLDDRPFDLTSHWEIFFGDQLDKLYKAEPNQFSWRRSQSEPIEVWNQMGPEFVRSYIGWRERSPYEIWTTPDGVPAIELDVSGFLPGCPVEIKGYVDRIFRDPVFDRLINVDLKTGKRPPKDAMQFGTYAALMEVKYGVKTDLGVPFMNRRATLGKPYELTEFTPEFVGEIFGKAWAQIQAGDFPATGIANGACFICDVASSCHAKGGPHARLYDPSHPEREEIPF